MQTQAQSNSIHHLLNDYMACDVICTSEWDDAPDYALVKKAHILSVAETFDRYFGAHGEVIPGSTIPAIAAIKVPARVEVLFVSGNDDLDGAEHYIDENGNTVSVSADLDVFCEQVWQAEDIELNRHREIVINHVGKYTDERLWLRVSVSDLVTQAQQEALDSQRQLVAKQLGNPYSLSKENTSPENADVVIDNEYLLPSFSVEVSERSSSKRLFNGAISVSALSVSDKTAKHSDGLDLLVSLIELYMNDTFLTMDSQHGQIEKLHQDIQSLSHGESLVIDGEHNGISRVMTIVNNQTEQTDFYR